MSKKSHSVFLVDDDPMQIQMLKDHLNDKLAVNITTFSTGEDCLSNLDKNPDIVVLDYHLNSVQKEAKNGLEILRTIKSRNPSTEVIILSGQDKIEVAVETMNNGAFDYVVKNESAFVRVENKIKNIYKNFKLQDNNKMLKTSLYFVMGVIVILTIIIVYLWKVGVVTDTNNTQF
ncbi:MAG: response regulator [Chitinophagales bacterium]|nr:response regulator [Chitinophagales bacterium]